MRKLAVALAAVSALTVSSAANAVILLSGSAGVDTPTILINNGASQSTIIWGQDLTGTGSFSGSIDFSNSLSGLYSIIVGTSTPGATIDSVTLAGIMGTSGSFSVTGPSSSPGSLTLSVPSALLGNYRVSYTGTAPVNPPGAAVTGNLTFRVAAVPEPATWGMMLLGFAGIGFAMRRRRQPTLAQIA